MLTPDKWLLFCYDQWVVRCTVNTEDETLWSLPALASDCSRCGWFRSLCSRFIRQGFYFTIRFTRWLFIRGTVLRLGFNRWLFSRHLTVLLNSSGYFTVYVAIIHQSDSSGVLFYLLFIWTLFWLFDLSGGYSSGALHYCLIYQGVIHHHCYYDIDNIASSPWQKKNPSTSSSEHFVGSHFPPHSVIQV